MSKIIKLTSQNVKRLSAVEITPNGNTVVIGGKNGQGKSSVLDSIMYALGGKDALPEMPVRKGEENAEIVIELGELIVRRTFTAAGGTNLIVSNKEGARYPSPQAILDKLVGTLSFDPLEFAKRSDTQAETLRKLVGLDFSAQDAEVSAVYNERTIVNRDIKSVGAQLAAKQLHEGVPSEEVSTADILKEQQTAALTNTENAKARARAGLLASTVTSKQIEKTRAEQSLSSKESELKEIQAQIGALKTQLSAAVSAVERSRKESDEALALVEKLVDIDLTPFQEKAKTAEQTNQKVRENAARAELSNKLNAAQKRSEGFTQKLADIEAAKTKAISEAKYPIPGLSFDLQGNVVFGGIPFSQASSADQCRVSIAIGVALNPKLRVLLIRDGSLLDDDSLAMVADIAAKNDAQVWIERVSTGGEVSVIIEDGHIKT